jgi:hypothetical protein
MLRRLEPNRNRLDLIEVRGCPLRGECLAQGCAFARRRHALRRWRGLERVNPGRGRARLSQDPDCNGLTTFVQP